MSANEENPDVDILFSEKRLKVKAFFAVTKEKVTVIKEEQELSDESDEESEDEDEATLWDNHPTEENNTDDELDVVCRPAEFRRNVAKNSRSKPYSVANQDYKKTFLSSISQVAAHEHHEPTILSTLQLLIAPLLQIENKQQELYRALCLPETEGDLAGVTLLEFVTILNLPKVTIYLVKLIFSQCFSHPEDALPYFRKQDGEGNTLIHDVVSFHGKAAINALRALLNFRFKKETSFVFDPTAVNKKGQHPLHLTMDKPVFQREIFDIFNRLDQGILKLADRSQNTLLHYALLNYDSICDGISNVEEKANHIVTYLQGMLAFEEIQECISIRNANGQTPNELVSTLDCIEDQVRGRIQEELSKVSFRRMISAVDQIPVNLPDDALLDQPQLDEILQEHCIALDTVNEAALNNQHQIPELFNPFPEEVFSLVEVIEEEFLMGWACTYVYDPECNATFQTPEERDAHMREVHASFEGSDEFGPISIDPMGLLDENIPLL